MKSFHYLIFLYFFLYCCLGLIFNQTQARIHKSAWLVCTFHAVFNNPHWPRSTLAGIPWLRLSKNSPSRNLGYHNSKCSKHLWYLIPKMLIIKAATGRIKAMWSARCWLQVAERVDHSSFMNQKRKLKCFATDYQVDH